MHQRFDASKDSRQCNRFRGIMSAQYFRQKAITGISLILLPARRQAYKQGKLALFPAENRSGRGRLFEITPD